MSAGPQFSVTVSIPVGHEGSDGAATKIAAVDPSKAYPPGFTVSGDSTTVAAGVAVRTFTVTVSPSTELHSIVENAVQAAALIHDMTLPYFCKQIPVTNATCEVVKVP